MSYLKTNWPRFYKQWLVITGGISLQFCECSLIEKQGNRNCWFVRTSDQRSNRYDPWKISRLIFKETYLLCAFFGMPGERKMPAFIFKLIYPLPHIEPSVQTKFCTNEISSALVWQTHTRWTSWCLNPNLPGRFHTWQGRVWKLYGHVSISLIWIQQGQDVKWSKHIHWLRLQS